jgi:hypothetical protein
MKHDHFLDAGSFGLSCAPPEFGDVRVANRAINEAPELQMDEALCIGEVYGLPGHGFHHRRRQHVSWLEFHGFPSRLSDPRPIYRFPPETRITSPYREPSLFAEAT